MPRSITQVQPALQFIPPQLNPLLVQAVLGILPLWMRFNTSVRQVQAHHVETLVDLYQRFQAGDVRFMMAFRHPSVDDPFSLGCLLGQWVPACAKQRGVVLRSPIHAHFLYDRGIPLWAGRWLGWLYSQMGGIPIQRGKLDRQGLRTARDLFANGTLPMIAAPEGATNGHSELISPLEPGVAQMGFWCVEDMVEAGRTEQVYIIPIGIQYRFLSPPWKALEALLTSLEADVGNLPSDKSQAALAQFPDSTECITGDSTTASIAPELSLYPRLYNLGVRILTLMEGFYQRFYHRSLPEPEPSASSTESHDPNQVLASRLQVLLDTALKVAEQYFDIQPKGNLSDRCRRLEQAAWDCIYREDLKNLDALSVVERGLADRIAEEADLRIWHMRLVENFVAVTGRYVREKPTAERFAETLLLTWETVARLKGESTYPRPRLGEQVATITVGEPISVSERWQDYQQDRRSAKQAVATLTQDIQTALEAMITSSTSGKLHS